MIAAIQKRQASNKAKESGVGVGDAEGHPLIGFGLYHRMTRQALYLSVSDEHRNCGRDLIHHPVTHPGGQLDHTKKNLLRVKRTPWKQNCVNNMDRESIPDVI